MHGGPAWPPPPKRGAEQYGEAGVVEDRPAERGRSLPGVRDIAVRDIAVRDGDGAVFGVAGSRFGLEFAKGFHQVRVDCGLSNGNADWTPADMRARLEPLAAAVAARMS